MDIDTYFRFSLALVFVIGLFFVVALVMRRFGLGSAAATPRRQRRVAVVEVTPLDAKRRLVLVRRDEVEHLILLSNNGDLVVEPAIRGGFRDAVAAAEAKGDTP
ncbi:MAG TPA: flagellar biosynthetic protein FliO [Azospirillum sp.]|nr:flagellar biosynthetic protein FliO [Azospirillum sp.]